MQYSNLQHEVSLWISYLFIGIIIIIATIITNIIIIVIITTIITSLSSLMDEQLQSCLQCQQQVIPLLLVPFA
jgi:hypothetical protein